MEFDETKKVSPVNKKTKTTTTTTTNKKTTRKSNKKLKEDTEVIEGPLTGYTIVISGESANISISRDRMSDILKGFGARVTKSVSGKTDYLVVGDILETGKPIEEGNKYKEATKHKTNITTMEEMAEIIRKKTNNSDFDFNTFSFDGQNNDNVNEEVKKNEEVKTSNKSYLKKKDENEKMNSLTKREIKNASKTKSAVVAYTENQLWANKYAPTSLDDIVGNKETINKLTKWLTDWDDVVLKGNKKEVNYSRGNFNSNLYNIIYNNESNN